MTKIEFIRALADRLANLPRHEVDRITSYYSEIVEDRMEDGMSEEEAVAALGGVEEAAQSAMLEMPLPVLMKARVNESKNNAESKALWILVAVLGFPLWFPLVIAALSVAFAAYVTVWSLIAALYAVVVSLAVAGVAGFFGGFFLMFSGSAPAGVVALGYSLCMIGVTLFLIKPVVIITKGLARLTVLIAKKIKSLFISKKEAGTNEVQ